MSDVRGHGEAIERTRRRRKYTIIGGAAAVGMTVGFMIGYTEAENFFQDMSGWPPAMAIGIALSYLAAVIGGGVALARHTDEVELQTQYKAVAVAAMVYILIYPTWFALWMGGLVPEPMHSALFIAFWLSLAGASLFYQFR